MILYIKIWRTLPVFFVTLVLLCSIVAAMGSPYVDRNLSSNRYVPVTVVENTPSLKGAGS